MKKLSATLFFLIVCLAVHAQGQFVHQASARWGTNLNDQAKVCALADNGAMLLAGTFSNTIDLDPGPNEVLVAAVPSATPPSLDVFVVKLNADGSYAWGFTLGNDRTELVGGAAFTQNGDVLLACSFSRAVDIDPGTDEVLSPATGNHSAVLRLDGQTGALQDHMILSSPVNQFFTSAHTVLGLEVDADGGFALHGAFGDNLDLDPSAGVAQVNTSGGSDAFVAKYDAAMDFEWGFALGGTGNFTDQTTDIRFDEDGALYVGGFFNAGTDFDPGADQAVIAPASSGRDVCVAKYAADGSFDWLARMVAPGSSDGLFGLEVFEDEVLLMGRFETSVDVDPGAGTETLTPITNNVGTYIVKLSASAGALLNAAQFDQLIEPVGGASANTHRRSMARTDDGHFVFIGDLAFGAYDMQIGPGTTNLQPNSGVRDIVLARYAWDDFSLSGAVRIGGASGSDEANAIAINSTGQILIAGGFRSSALNVAMQGPAVNLQNAGSSSSDAFCARYAWSNSTTHMGEMNAQPLHAFPNPFTDVITLDGAWAGTNRVRIFDATGRLAAEASGTLPLTVDLGLLPAGSYTAQVIADNGPAVFRLMKE